MARLSDRRPGNSRRAQYGVFTGYVIAMLGVVVGVIVLVMSLINPQAFSFARSSAAEVARPMGKAGAEGRAAGQSVFGAIGAYFNAGQQNAELRREVDAARADAVSMQALQSENLRLKALLGIVDPANKPVATVHLIGSTASSTRRFAIIDAGSDRGVEPGFPVRAASGLIGRVLEVGPYTARVLLVTDPENVVPVRRARDGLAAFVQGASNGKVDIRLINTGVNLINKGDIFVTSGSGGLYPPGIPVAVASDPHRDGATGLLTADPADNEFVIVEPSYQAPAAAQLLQITKDGAGTATVTP